MSHNDALHNVINSIRPMLQNMPGLHFVKDLNSRYVEISQDVAAFLGMHRNYIVDKLDCNLPWEEVADQLCHNDLVAIHQHRSDVFEPLPIESNKVFVTRCVKFPIQDQKGNVIGVIGQTYIFSQKETMGDAIKALMSFDHKNAINANKKYNAYEVREYPADFNLTERETECLFLLIRGKTAKEIGRFLTISPRTVEVYVENIKRKMNATSRSDIINKAEILGMLTIIPKNTIRVGLQKNSPQWKNFFNE